MIEQRTVVEAVAIFIKDRRGAVVVTVGLLGAFLAVQTYFTRELLAAELLFGLLFLALLLILASVYLIGMAGERALELAEAQARHFTDLHHRPRFCGSGEHGLALIEAQPRKPKTSGASDRSFTWKG